MSRLSFSLIAAALLALTTAPSFAAVVTHPVPTDPGCQVNCEPPGEQGNPGEPFIPPEFCMINCDDSSTIPDPKLPDPDKPGVTPQFATLGGCGEKLGALRHVSVPQIRGVGENDAVDIIPVCRSKSLAAEQDDVADLRPEIDQNTKLHGELGGGGYDANDVVGVVVDGRSVTIYVHHK